MRAFICICYFHPILAWLSAMKSNETNSVSKHGWLVTLFLVYGDSKIYLYYETGSLVSESWGRGLLYCVRVRLYWGYFLWKSVIQYQPSGTRADCLLSETPHRLQHVTAHSIQSGWFGLIWALPSIFAKKVFWCKHSFYEKSRRQEKRNEKRKEKKKEKKEKNVVFSGH